MEDVYREQPVKAFRWGREMWIGWWIEDGGIMMMVDLVDEELEEYRR